MSAHLAAFAVAPRPAGTDASLAAQEYCAEQLAAQGFSVTRRPFTFSAIPGRYAAPIIGALGVWLGISTALGEGFRLAALYADVAIVIAAAALGSRWATRLPLLREHGVNLEATRGEKPRVWLVAHIDSKSQPVSTAVRTLGVSLIGAAVLFALIQRLLVRHAPGASGTVVVTACAIVGGVILVASVVGAKSDGVADNGSGVAAVLEAASLVDPNLAVGVLITDAEELALAGARDWVRGRDPGVAINCDTIDDEGPFRLMHYGSPFDVLIPALQAARNEGIDVKLMAPLPGVLTDSVAFKAAKWRTVTLCRGTLRTLNRIHTTRDDLGGMSGTGIPVAARLLARLAEELA